MSAPREPARPASPSSRALEVADAAFVTDQLLVGGDLDTRDHRLAATQLRELLDAGLTHLVDARVEWSDEEWVRQLAPQVGYLHHGMDDAGQRVPGAWFDRGVDWALEAVDRGGVVLTHCHMGINRGPSLGFAVLLAQGWDPVQALDRIRSVRPIAWVAYAEEALRWHHDRAGSTPAQLAADQQRLADWRATHELDLAAVIRRKRAQGW
ncbi:protein-tyrosine phosphatase family protein [Nocardioides aurantiacus]|uniref:Protein-tyrosine phosphatase n=1 Tax=Nocardioides aurantiacus TaxID=86796 RepID=A0A3N2CQW0_9ACTN|nr:dual specificity protein phosphatase [Nocardioides aurantiacus]ROR89786.1 protein-tyrosine phosphatase [Nocardioides aurantiacus]